MLNPVIAMVSLFTRMFYKEIFIEKYYKRYIKLSVINFDDLKQNRVSKTNSIFHSAIKWRGWTISDGKLAPFNFILWSLRIT